MGNKATFVAAQAVCRFSLEQERRRLEITDNGKSTKTGNRRKPLEDAFENMGAQLVREAT